MDTKTVPVTLALYGTTLTRPQTTDVPSDVAEELFGLFRELKTSIVSHPFDDQTQQLKDEFITLLSQQNLLPASIPPNQYSTLLNPPWFEKLRKNHDVLASLPLQGTAGAGAGSAVVCSLAGEGIGILFPFVMLPRPRLVTTWSSLDGNTVVGKLLTIGGFAAGGAQFGFALGFWGIGLAYATPYGTLYGFIGYSLFTLVTAQLIERYPPDYPPEIIATDPTDGEKDVPLALSELRFSIEDPSGDLMRYEVTTDPDIGSGSGTLKPAGTYSLPVQGAKSNTEYHWTLKVSDDVQTTEQTFSFTTEAIAPIISDERPMDGDRYVLETQAALSFHLRDPQYDLMSYTVETSPFIGSGSGSGVSEGDIMVPITGLAVMTEYHWFVNVTDGVNPTSEAFWFRTGPVMVFDPFAEGWIYRKMITIDHMMVAGDLQHFPVVLSFSDSDLRDKVQPDGDDILFMDGVGVATRMYHEIELFDGTTGRLVSWVNVSSLSPISDTVFYLYYGNEDSSDQQCPEKVWDAGFALVQHFDEKSGALFDSTMYSNDGTPYGGVNQDVVGKIGNAYAFDGSDDYVECMNSPSLNPSDSISLEAWFKPVSFRGTGSDPLIDKGYNPYSEGPHYQYHLAVVGDQYPVKQAEFEFYVANSGFQNVLTGVDFWVPHVWYHIVGTYDGTTEKIYVNGVLLDSREVTSIMADFGENLRIASYTNRDYYLPGTIDEVRVSSSALSSAWILTEYQNQNDPSGFSDVGVEEPHP